MNEINKTMLDQFGGRKSLAMIGCQVVYNNTDNRINIHFKMCRKANIFQIAYNSVSDMYDVAFFKNTKLVEKIESVSNDSIQQIFEEFTGLRLSLSLS